jgi:enoyl-[acyl-carrier-protein] reductase (NADH)
MAQPTIPAAACTTARRRKVALIMGVANQRSIAWAVTQ